MFPWVSRPPSRRSLGVLLYWKEVTSLTTTSHRQLHAAKILPPLRYTTCHVLKGTSCWTLIQVLLAVHLPLIQTESKAQSVSNSVLIDAAP